VRCNGVELNVVEAGEGRPVLLLHGFPDSHRLWRGQVPVLVDTGHRAITPDLPGYGESEAPLDMAAYRMRSLVVVLTDLLDQLGVERVSLVGHDWGAALAWGFAALKPERVDHLVALSVGHPAVPRKPAQLRDFWYMLLFQDPSAEELLSEDDWSLFRRSMGDPEDVERYVEDLSRPGRLTAALNWYRANHNVRAFVNGGRVPDVSRPALGVWSTGDFACGEDQMVDSADHVTGPWRYERIDGASHWIPLAAPRRLNDLLVEFLREH
jgi:pimeloyl-ACP methyl ester carboxylesterase